MSTLPTNFQDDILSPSQNNKRTYRMYLPDGSTQDVQFEDISNYDQVGSIFGAAQINATNGEVNGKIDTENIIASEADLSALQTQGYVADALLTKGLSENLTANGQPFYFDTHDGKYGWNESSARGADTFHPFSSDLTLETQISNYPRFDSNNSEGTRTFAVPSSLSDATKVYAVITGTFENYYNSVTWSCSGGNIITNTSCVSSSGNSAPFKTFITTMKLTGNSVSVTYKPFADHHISVTFIGS